MNPKNIDDIGFVKLSKHRKTVLIDLEKQIKIPTEISNSTGLSISDVSRSLRALKEKK